MCQQQLQRYTVEAAFLPWRVKKQVRKKPAPKEVKPCGHRAVSTTRVLHRGEEAETHEGCRVGELGRELF